jgi:hypothetical protein
MATYFLYLTPSNGGARRGVKVIRNLIPLPLKYEYEEDSDAFGGPGKGAVTEYAGGIRLRTGIGGAGIVELEGFSADTVEGEGGTGMKSSGIGTFPDGDLRWICDAVS